MHTYKPSSKELGDLRHFCIKWLRTTVKNSRPILNFVVKHIAVDDLTKTFAMVPLSSQTNLAGEYGTFNNRKKC